MSQLDAAGRISAFSTALCTALYDRKIEILGKRLKFFFDSDVIYKAVMGFEAIVKPATAFSTRDPLRVLCSLISCGFLQNAQLLEAHLIELVGKLKSAPRYVSKGERVAFQTRAREFLRSTGTWDILDDLRSLSRRYAETGTQELRAELAMQFFQRFRGSSGDLLTAVEATHGTWPHRYRDLKRFQCVNLELQENSSDELATDDSLAYRLFMALNQIRLGREINNFRDAIAMSRLASMVRMTDTEDSTEQVRFTTGSSALLNSVLRDAESRSSYEYKLASFPEHELSKADSTVFRSPEYFAMRCWFEELGFDSKVTSLKRFDSLCSQLEGIKEANGDSLERALQAIEFEGSPIVELMTQFEDLTFMSSVWQQPRPPAALEARVLDWTDVFAFVKGEISGQMLFDEITEVFEDLDTTTYVLDKQVSDFAGMYRAIGNRRKRIRGELLDPMRDLGLIRWGYDLPASDEAELVGWTKRIADEEEEQTYWLALEASRRMRAARESAGDCLLMCAFLWALGRYREIVVVVDELQENRGSEVRPSLRLIRSAAMIRSGVRSFSQKRRLIGELLELVEAVGQQDERGLLLGVGYVLFHAWKQETAERGASALGASDRAAVLMEWLDRCYEFGEEAVERFEKGTLAWAFAVNHCAYVGLIGGIRRESTLKYLSDLMRIAANPSFTNARFFDTIGCFYLLNLEALAERRQGGEELKERREVFEKAEEYFRRAKNVDVGDIDLDEHISRLDVVREALWGNAP